MVENTIEWVDIHDEDLMVELGIHYPDYEEPDFSKTSKEKKLLAKFRKSTPEVSSGWPRSYIPSFPLYDKLIVHLKRNQNFPKTTYSHKIWQYQLDNIVNSYKNKKGNTVVDYYIWNGKRYNADERPVNPYYNAK